MAGESLAKLIELVAYLRGPDGCAWDCAQGYDSMKGLLLEEAYEVIDALNKRDFDELEDELGDLLFQIAFYARLAEEEQRFTLDDVIERLHAKLVRRHPHVFGETRASTPEEALQSWLTVKEREQEGVRNKKQGASSSLLDGIPEALPATLEAYELGVRAAEVGFDWVKIEDLLDKVAEEVVELRQEALSDNQRRENTALSAVGEGVASGASPVRGFSQPQQQAPETPQSIASPGTPGTRFSPTLAASGLQSDHLEEEIGDLLFAVSNLARYLGSDPESCLRRANQKFNGRFRALEREVAKQGKRMGDCSPEELDRLWKAVKNQEREARSQKPEGRSKKVSNVNGEL
jgi:MazG family protein